MIYKERYIQESVVYYLRVRHSDVLFCASAGGMRTYWTQAKLMKRLGYSKGFPDLFIYEPAGNYKGMAIEFKSDKGRLTFEQSYWLKELEKRGYYVYIGRNVNETIKEIEKYLNFRKEGEENVKNKEKN
ncbi:MAG: VRR-NUC domain-containing protein [Candidatus Aenigmatarchaeota archaeon]